MKRNNKKKNRIMLLLILLLAISVGFALLSTTLKINGTTNISKSSWNVYWSNVQVNQQSVNPATNPPTIGQDTNDPVNTKVTWSTTLTLPGDFYEFTVDATNAGSIDAMITDIDETLPSSMPSCVNYSVTYDDGIEIAEKHTLPKATVSNNVTTPTTQTYKIRVEIDSEADADDLAEIPADGLELSFEYDVTYSQADDTAIPKPVGGFATDSWATIKTKVTANKSAYNVGDTKIIMLDLDGDDEDEMYFLRVANNTTPSECAQEGFSQTACGFVIEFTEAITEHRMNPYASGTNYDNGYGTQGGWEYSDMRAYLNSTTYTAGNIDYSTTGIYDKFPSDLKTAIIPTTVVSGHGSRDSANHTTTDYLYLFDAKELYGDTFVQTQNTAKDFERQLDYYYAQGVIDQEGTRDPVVKYAAYDTSSIGAVWYLRSANSEERNSFYSVTSAGGKYNDQTASATNGVSPAFRIAE